MRIMLGYVRRDTITEPAAQEAAVTRHDEQTLLSK